MNNTFHFIFGLSENFNNKPFCYFHYLCIKSCYLTQNNPNIYIHCIYEPINNQWWEMTKDLCKIIKYTILPDSIYKCNNKKVWRIEHQSDIFRLLILKEQGGVYADIDTLFYKPYHKIFNEKKFVIGIETFFDISKDNIKINGLCNALMISEKNSEFIDIWLDSYKNEYDDYDWNKMSVRKPHELYQKYPQLIHVEDAITFHKYNWSHLFYSDDEKYNFYTEWMTDEGILSKHIAESKIYDIIKNIDRGFFDKNNSLYSKMCKNINGLLE